MKTNRTENLEDEEFSDQLQYSNFPNEGVGVLKAKEWENGEGFDFIFSDGTVSLSYYEFMAMNEIYLRGPISCGMAIT